MLYYERKARRKGYNIIAGIDEAGRGPWAGPVVAAAVVLRDFSFTNRIDDSKKLTPQQRKKAFSEIKKKASLGIGIISPAEIDRVNILNATKMAMEKAVSELDKWPDCLLIDGKIRFPGGYIIENIIGGDGKSLSIACASIVAKVTRDNIMSNYDKLYDNYGFKRHKGYGTPQHHKALKKFGPCPIHRISYRPVQELVK